MGFETAPLYLSSSRSYIDTIERPFMDVFFNFVRLRSSIVGDAGFERLTKVFISREALHNKLLRTVVGAS
jgi:hypothetical protein